MKQMERVLAAIQADPEQAVAVLRAALEADPGGFVVELATFIVGALDGAVPDA